MKNKILRGFFAILTLAAITNILPDNAIAGSKSASVDKVRDDFNTAFNAGNAISIARLIDRNGVWLPPGKPVMTGKENITAYYTAYFQKTNSTIELKPGDIWVCEKWAFLSGDFIRMDTPKTGGGTSQITGHYLFALKKQINGAWKIARDIWNESGAPSKP